MNLLDNCSEFLAPLGVEVRREERDYVIEVHGAIAIADTIAYLSEMVDPISIFLSLTREDLTRQVFRFLFLGRGRPACWSMRSSCATGGRRPRTTCGRGSTSSNP